MTTTTLKRNEKSAFDNIKAVNELEDIKSLEVADSNMKFLIKDYETALEPNFKEKYGYIGALPNEQLLGFKNPSKIILTPEEINLFLKETSRYESHENYKLHTGRFISVLIQNSYDAGHNKFNFGINSLGFLGSMIEGSDENPIRINIDKSNDGFGGFNSKHSTFNIRENNAEATGRFSEYSIFNIVKNHGGWVGASSKHSTFNIETNKGDGVGRFTENCIFKSPNKETLDSITARSREGNQFYLIQPDGKEIPYEK